MRSTFKQLFYINRQKEKKNGKCPVMGRITIDGKVCQYSTGYEIDPCLWNPSTGRAFTSGKIMEVLTAEEKTNIKRLNMQLDGLIKKGEEAYKRNLAGIGYVSAEIVKMPYWMPIPRKKDYWNLWQTTMTNTRSV